MAHRFFFLFSCFSFYCHFSLGSTKCKRNQVLLLHPFWPQEDASIQESAYLQFQCSIMGATPANSSALSRKHCWRKDDTWCHSHLHLQSPGDNQHQTEAAVEQNDGEFRNRQIILFCVTVLIKQFFVKQHNIWKRSLACVSSLKPDLSEQGCSCSAQVVGDEQLGVGVDSCWVELPQRL